MAEPVEFSRTLFFGERWDAPRVDDARQVPTPVGAVCSDCGELVDDGDRGLMRNCARADGAGGWQVSVEAVHAECDLRTAMGHVVGVCSCTGFDASRATAKLVWQAVSQRRGRDLAVRDDDL